MNNFKYNYTYNVNYNPNNTDEKEDIQYKKDFLNVFNLTSYNDKKIEKIRSEMFSLYKNNKQIKNIFNTFKQYQKRIPFVLPDETIFTFLFCFDYFVFFHVCLGDLHLNNKISELNYNKLINTIKN
jgi:hypothetical protein